MREIKFRGKRLDNGEWVCGDLHHGILATTYHENIYINGFKVDKETVGQFTGLYDKNGKEIYEGDILRNVDNPMVDNEPYEVYWEEDYSGGWFWKDKDSCDPFFRCIAETSEIIGNTWGV